MKIELPPEGELSGDVIDLRRVRECRKAAADKEKRESQRNAIRVYAEDGKVSVDLTLDFHLTEITFGVDGAEALADRLRKVAYEIRVAEHGKTTAEKLQAVLSGQVLRAFDGNGRSHLSVASLAKALHRQFKIAPIPAHEAASVYLRKCLSRIDEADAVAAIARAKPTPIDKDRAISVLSAYNEARKRADVLPLPILLTDEQIPDQHVPKCKAWAPSSMRREAKRHLGCLQAKGHDGKHRVGQYEWTDEERSDHVWMPSDPRPDAKILSITKEEA